MSALTAQAVNTQLVFDAAYEDDLDRFAVVVAQTAPEWRDLLKQLAPQRMLIREFRLSLSLSLVTERDTEFRVRAFPLNINYSLRHSMNTENESRLEMCVEQVPLVQDTLSRQRGLNNG